MEKVLLKLTFCKTLSLTNIIHIFHFRHNLVLVHLLGMANLKILFDDDMVNLSKNKVFVGKGYDADALFNLMLIKSLMKMVHLLALTWLIPLMCDMVNWDT